ncbi:hypothetical protein C8Q79DRAFT_308221 [Trametes meyenii]|nr:hypothetical protein C8Q79DRAFT_308221 [Trametes meyenii]
MTARIMGSYLLLCLLPSQIQGCIMSDTTQPMCQALIDPDGTGGERCYARLATFSKPCCPIHKTAYNKSYQAYKAASTLADSLRVHARIRRSEVNRLSTKSIRLHLDGIGRYLQAVEQELRLRGEHDHRFFIEVDSGHKGRLVKLERDLENGRMLERALRGRDALLRALDPGRSHAQLCGPGGKGKVESIRSRAGTPTPQGRGHRRHARRKNGKGKATSNVGPPRKLCEKGEEQRRAPIKPVEKARKQEEQSPKYIWEGERPSQLPFCDARLPDTEVQNNCSEPEERGVRDIDALCEEKYLEPLSLANAGYNPAQRWSQMQEEVLNSAYKDPFRIPDVSEPQRMLLLDRGAEGLASSQTDTERETWPRSTREVVQTDEVGTFTGTSPRGPEGGAPPTKCTSNEAEFLTKIEVTQRFPNVYTKCSWDVLVTPAWVTSLPSYVASPGGGVELVKLRTDTPSKVHLPSGYEDLVTPGVSPTDLPLAFTGGEWAAILGSAVHFGTKSHVEGSLVPTDVGIGESVGGDAEPDANDLRQGTNDSPSEAALGEPEEQRSEEEVKKEWLNVIKQLKQSVGEPNYLVPSVDRLSSANIAVNERPQDEHPTSGPRHSAHENPGVDDTHAKYQRGGEEKQDRSGWGSWGLKMTAGFAVGAITGILLARKLPHRPKTT